MRSGAARRLRLGGVTDTAFLARHGDTPAAVRDHLRARLSDFEESLARCQDRWFTPVGEHLAAQGRTSRYRALWSPAQQAEHVLKANTGFSKIIYLLNGSRELPSLPRERGPLQDGRRVAPPNFQPGDGVAWSALEGPWREAHARLLSEIEKIDAASTRLFWHPYLGDLNALGWAQVAVWHTHDHRRQLGLDE